MARHETHQDRVTAREPVLALARSRRRAGDAHRSRRDRQRPPRPPSPAAPASPCLAVSRTTGFQVKVGSSPATRWACPATARSSPGRSRSASRTPRRSSSSTPTRAASPKRASRSCARSEAATSPTSCRRRARSVKLQPYFGKTVQFPLETTITVKKGDDDRADRAHLGARRWRSASATTPPGGRAARRSQCTSTSTPDGSDADRLARCSTTACTRPRA